MKTIEEAAREYQTKIYEDVFEEGSLSEQKLQCINDFKAGVAFAEEWISVKDELPENSIDIIFKTRGKRIYYGFYGLSCNFYAEVVDIFGKNIMIDKVTHWRPINRK